MSTSKKPFTAILNPPSLFEFDMGGVLYHANYFHLYEQTREAFLSSGGIPYSHLVRDGSHLAVTESWQRFHSPLFYGQDLRVVCWTTRVRGASAFFCYSIQVLQKEEWRVIHEAGTKHVFVHQTNTGLAPSRFPPRLRDILLSIEQEGS